MCQDKVHPGQAAHSAGSWVVIRNLVRLSLEVPSAESQLCPTGSLTRSELSHRGRKKVALRKEGSSRDRWMDTMIDR